MSHFQASSKVAREMRILQEIRRIEWRETAGELGALLLESRLVKELQPIHNRLLRKEKQLLAWKLHDDPTARPQLQLVRMDDVNAADMGQLYGVYRSKRQALDTLRTLADAHQLCPFVLGLESGKGACFASQIGRCKGVCAGREAPALHRVRLHMALAAHRLQAWPHAGCMGIREHNALTDRTDIHVFDQWCHIATVHDDVAMEDAITVKKPLAFDLDTYRLLLKRLTGNGLRSKEVFHLGAAPHQPQ